MTVGEAGNGASVSTDELSARLVVCLEQGDLDGLVALYTEDAVLLPPGRPGMAGRQPVAQFWRELAGRIDQVQAETTGIRRLGRDELLETGILRFRVRGVSPDQLAGKYLVAWTRLSSGWRITHDIWNLDT